MLGVMTVTDGGISPECGLDACRLMAGQITLTYQVAGEGNCISVRTPGGDSLRGWELRGGFLEIQQ